MKVSTFINKLQFARTKKVKYCWGTFGNPITTALLTAKKAQYPTWYTLQKEAEIGALIGQGYFGFDCVGLIKGILWGWSANPAVYNGGALYLANGVPDSSANGFFNICTNKSSDFKNIVVGAMVHVNGHIGVYIGNNQALEVTTRWDAGVGVQLSGVQNLGNMATKSRRWSSWGLCPFIDYSDVIPDVEPVDPEIPEDTTPIGDDLKTPDEVIANKILSPLSREYTPSKKFRPLGASVLYSVDTSELVGGKLPTKDNNGMPIPDGAICEVHNSTTFQNCDLYRYAFGAWWKYANDVKQQIFSEYPRSPISTERYPVQVIAFDAYEKIVRLLCAKDKLFVQAVVPSTGDKLLSGISTNKIDGIICDFIGGQWVNTRDYIGLTWNVKQVYESNSDIKDTDKTTNYFNKNVG
jgi:hypothetical protein